MGGLFSEWQPRYAACGVATFPVRDKRPAVSRYLRMGVPASRQLAIRFPHEDAFGLACRPNRIAVLDVDSPDERLFADALSEFGPTPFLVRSGSGNHQAWYRHNGEKRQVRPDPARPIDILGDGFVVAPPSRTAKGSYVIIGGSLEDLDRLPPMRRPAARASPSKTSGVRLVETGRRNQELWRACMKCAGESRDVTELMRKAAEMNQVMFYEPLPHEEVLRVVASAWTKEISGENWFGRGGRVVLDAAEVDQLGRQHPDALILLAFLKRHHWGKREFVVANAMAAAIGQTRKRFSVARRQLEIIGEIALVRPACRQRGPALYRFKGGQN